MGLYSPKDFASEAPPPRIMGSEMEYTPSVTLEDGERSRYLRSLIGAVSLVLPDVKENIQYLPNGSRLYPDVKLVEYATPESLGPQEVALADIAGENIMKLIADIKRGEKHPIFRRTGIEHNVTKSTSVGYHENYLTSPYEKKSLQLLEARVVGSFLATRPIWAGAGAIANGFVLSQKAHSIINEDDSRLLQIGDLKNVTVDGKKPMLSWSSGLSSDIVSHARGWERLEIRYADALHSPWGRYMAFASTSLVLRVLEHRAYFTTEEWQKVTLKDIATTTKLVSTDTNFAHRFPLESGEMITALELQKRFADLAYRLVNDKQVLLPDDELRAVREWQNVCEDLESVHLGDPNSLLRISDRVEWAARYLMMYRKLGHSLLCRYNGDAINVDLAWDQIYPHSFAEKYWKKKQPDFYSKHEAEISSLVEGPPLYTRAHARARTIRNHTIIESVRWDLIKPKNRVQIPLNDPFDFRP